jgi:excisionase family DNA binding protein
VEEVVIDLDDAAHEAIILIHWVGGRHTELRVPRARTGRRQEGGNPGAVEVVKKLGGHWPDREISMTLNRIKCRTETGETWTAMAVRLLRERLSIPDFDPTVPRPETMTADKAAKRLGLSIPSVLRLIQRGVLPATQLVPSAPWHIPIAALDTDAVRTGVNEIKARRPKNLVDYHRDEMMRLPGL